MPLGNPEAYMDQGIPPEQAMAMAGPPPPMGMDPAMGPPPMGPPPMGPPGMGAPPDENMMLQMLMEAVTGKWSSDEAQLAGEKGMLIETLMSIAQAQPPMPQDMFAEGVPDNAGMMPQDDLEQYPMG